MEAIHVNHCAQGVHLLGNAGSNNVGQHFLSNYHPEAIDNGDALLLEDINDIEVVNMNGMAAGGATVEETRFTSKARALPVSLRISIWG